MSRRLGFVVVLVVLGLTSAVALAQEPAPHDDVPVLDPSLAQLAPGPDAIAQTSSAMQATIAAEEHAEAERATPAAEAERQDSRDSYTSLGASGSKQLLQETFSDQLDELDNDPGRVVSDLDVDQYVGVNAAIVEQPGGHKALIQSSIPMRNGTGSSADELDLSLEHEAGHFEPDFPLVDTRLPSDLSQPITFPDSGISIDADPAGSSSTPSAHVVGDSDLFFHEAATDTDVWIAPVGQGAEVFTQLRSPQAPETLDFDVDLPEGTQLVPSVAGGFSITRGGQEIGTIPKPTAVDAQGAPIEVETSVTEDGLRLYVPHREQDVAYPALVDPVYEQWLFDSSGWAIASWYFGNNLQGLWTWPWATNTGAAPYDIMARWDCAFPGNPSFTCFGNTHYGLWAYTRSNVSYGTNRYGQFVYTVPGGTGTPAFVHRVQFGQVSTDRHNCTSQAEPHPYLGIWNTNTGSWEGYGSAWWNLSYPEYYSNANTGDDMVVVGMGTGGSNGYIPCWRDFMVGGAVITLMDFESPQVSGVSFPLGPGNGLWYDDEGPRPITAQITDQGLGVKDLVTLGAAQAGGYSISTAVHPCTGAKVFSECPHSWSVPDSANGQTLSFNPSQLISGASDITLIGHDVGGTSTDPMPLHVKIDHGAPNLNVSGTLRQAGVPGSLVIVDANDGDPSGAGTVRSGVRRVDVYMDGSVRRSTGDLKCNENWGSCPSPLHREWYLNAAAVLGTHQFKVVAIDNLGHETEATWSQTTGSAGTVAKTSFGACNLDGSPDISSGNKPSWDASTHSYLGTNCNDEIDVPRGATFVDAAGGDDVISVGAFEAGARESVIVRAGSGRDQIMVHGKGNQVHAHGDGGDDTIYGGSDDDHLYGDADNDILIGGSGADVLDGGPQNDVLLPGGGTDYADGGSGKNTLSYADGVEPGFLTTNLPPDPRNGAPLTLPAWFPPQGDRRGVLVDLTGRTVFDGDAWEGGGTDHYTPTFSRVVGSAFGDAFVGQGTQLNVIGGPGVDAMVLAGNGNSLDGGTEADSLLAQGANNSVDGGGGSDGCFADGGPNNCDRKGSQAPFDPLPTGVTAEPTSAALFGTFANGGVGSDEPNVRYVYFRGSSDPDSVRVSNGGSDVYLDARNAKTRGDFSLGGNSHNGCNHPSGNQERFTCDGSAQLVAVVVSGGGAHDALTASLGRVETRLKGSPAATSVVLLGGSDGDTLEGGYGNDVLVDGDETAKNSSPSSGADDLLKGGSGNDVLWNNFGTDNIYGDQGEDLLASTSVCQHDRIDGGPDGDAAQFAKIPDADGVSATLGSGVTPGNVGTAGDPNCGTSSGGNLVDAEDIEGSRGPDRLWGNAEPNRLLGREGLDELRAGGGNDVINAKDKARDAAVDCGNSPLDVAHVDLGKKLSSDKHDIVTNCPPGGVDGKGATYDGSGSGGPLPPGDSDSSSDAEMIADGAGSLQGTTPAEFYPLDEDDSTVIGDLNGDPIGALQGAPSGYAQGVAGALEGDSRALSLGGQGGYISITDSLSPGAPGTAGYAIEAWVRFDRPVGGNEPIFSRVASGNGFSVGRLTDGRISATVSAAQNIDVQTDASVASGTWHHIVLSISTDRVALFVDGVPSVATGVATMPSPSSTPLLLGANQAATAFLGGGLDDVSVYATPLTPQEVISHLAISSAPLPAELPVATMNALDGASDTAAASVADGDGDGVPDGIDNCPGTVNADQSDRELDGLGDACAPPLDSDGDGVAESVDNCPLDSNSDQLDSDSNGVGDACEFSGP